MLTKDVDLNDSLPNEFLADKHINYLSTYLDNKDGYEQTMVEYLRMSGIYWGITAMKLLHKPTIPGEKEEIVEFIKKCQHDCGGISASVGHDPHLLYTLSALQILALYDALDEGHIDIEKVVSYIKSLQQPDGSFYGDKWAEVDSRFSFCAIASLSLLRRLDEINVDAAVDFVMKCNNLIDGGFGSRPGSESHAGLIYCCLGSLSLTGQLDRVDADLLGWWLCERQLPSGGLNGRPEKLPDLCYSWWVLTSLQILGRLHWIDSHKLIKFIFACQDEETGGFSDRPGNLVDPFHTVFGVTGLSLLAYEYRELHDMISDDKDDKMIDINNLKSRIKQVNPVFCLPQDIVNDIKVQLLSL